MTVIQKYDWKFIRDIFAASVIVSVLAFYPVYRYASEIQVYSIVSGYLLSLLNILTGFTLNEIAFEKKIKSFMVIVIGGMTLRMVLVIILLVLLLHYAVLDTVYLVSSVFFFYFVFTSIEIYHISKKSGSKVLKPI
jgi:hypothetical protein